MRFFEQSCSIDQSAALNTAAVCASFDSLERLIYLQNALTKGATMAEFDIPKLTLRRRISILPSIGEFIR
jgi:hypothetical protein